MKIRINSIDFENAKWDVNNGIGRMGIHTNNTIAEILNLIGENNNIEVYDDNDVMVSTWYNSGILGANCIKYENENQIDVSFSVSILDENTQQQMQGDIDDSVDAIMELAEIISSIEETISEQDDAMKSLDGKVDDSVEEINGKIDKSNADIFAIREKANKNEKDIAEVDAKIEAIPNDIRERFGDLWDNYNALADRVARLENAQ